MHHWFSGDKHWEDLIKPLVIRTASIIEVALMLHYIDIVMKVR